jgi:uncharacterized membrane protein YtjA (UPF0391 family)
VPLPRDNAELRPFFRSFDVWHEICLNQIERAVFTNQPEEEFLMFNWALTFLIVAIVAAVFGFSGIAGTASNIAWILFVVGIILAIVFALTGRRPRI